MCPRPSTTRGSCSEVKQPSKLSEGIWARLAFFILQATQSRAKREGVFFSKCHRGSRLKARTGMGFWTFKGCPGFLCSKWIWSCSRHAPPGARIRDYAPPHGLAQAFLRAGVPHVVASRWDVDSVSTRIFMRDFYHKFVMGRSPAAAIALAARSILQRPGTAHPYYWAAFNAFGVS